MAPSNPPDGKRSLPRRRYAHLRTYDYAQAGWYFVTICVEDRRCVFGEIVDGRMRPNAVGTLVQFEWEGLPGRFPGVELDEWILMPNHIHGIIVLSGDTTPDVIETVRAFKAVCTTRIRKTLLRTFSWQRGVHDRVIRNERELTATRGYIVNNPMKWALDRENPDR